MNKETIQKKIIRMVAERDSMGKSATPSWYWSSFCDVMNYMFDCSEKSLGQLRLHTYHLDGDNYQKYFFKHHYFLYRRYYKYLTKNVPEKYRLSAPLILGEPAYKIGSAVVSDAVLRWQHVVNSLGADFFDNVNKKKETKNILEISAGYGSLTYYLSNLLSNSRFFIVDLPEILIFSSIYLAEALPHKKMYIYEKETFEQNLKEKFAQYGIVILPNFVFEKLENFVFDAVFNVQSFQEMTANQLATYLDYIEKHLAPDGILYSWNHDKQLMNPENFNVSSELYKRFKVKKISRAIDTLYSYACSASIISLFFFIKSLHPKKILNAFKKPDLSLSIHEYICTKKRGLLGRLRPD